LPNTAPSRKPRVCGTQTRIDTAADLHDALAMASDEEEEALKARRDRLAADLKAFQPKTAPPKASPSDGSAGAAWSLGAKAGAEFVGSVVVGGAIGYGLDLVLHTKPAFTIMLFLFGVAAGVYGVIRSTSPKGGGTAP